MYVTNQKCEIQDGGHKTGSNDISAIDKLATTFQRLHLCFKGPAFK